VNDVTTHDLATARARAGQISPAQHGITTDLLMRLAFGEAHMRAEHYDRMLADMNLVLCDTPNCRNYVSPTGGTKCAACDHCRAEAEDDAAERDERYDHGEDYGTWGGGQ